MHIPQRHSEGGVGRTLVWDNFHSVLDVQRDHKFVHLQSKENLDIFGLTQFSGFGCMLNARMNGMCVFFTCGSRSLQKWQGDRQ